MSTRRFEFLTEEHHPSLSVPGPVIPVVISVPEEAQRLRLVKGLPCPRPIEGLALIDTGSSVSAIDQLIVRRLKLPAQNYIKSSSPSGPFMSSVHQADFQFPTLGELRRPKFPVVKCELDWRGPYSPSLAMLIGRDILSSFAFLYCGTHSNWTIRF
jgi:hypothetical protein